MSWDMLLPSTLPGSPLRLQGVDERDTGDTHLIPAAVRAPLQSIRTTNSSKPLFFFNASWALQNRLAQAPAASTGKQGKHREGVHRTSPQGQPLPSPTSRPLPKPYPCRKAQPQLSQIPGHTQSLRQHQKCSSDPGS